ncbi:isopeptide-forming domain-containing fimbrial protein [Bifidobacterium sp. ESL0800]|uniref:isopeptide-forming domain-containing fimbrial protein n=1 Tax=Bifidobacterium sp. ESL0800 TaxID=2983236 RepID=UPI0023F7AEC6|nr:isopeptide-forming domain-containing fimbrial protein [Bifidobacterium sp. ESL0800]WEV75778.1 isopeptide-forming domain-containing fimbrial protein [Bifidobacterium sp. ESL0800]
MRKQHFRVGALSARHALSADGHSSDLYESQEKQGQAILSGTGHMKKKQWKRALGALVSCLVAAATLMSGAVSANASQPDAEQTPTHGPQPYVTLKIKNFKDGLAGNDIQGIKLADYTNQDRDKNTLDATTVSKVLNGRPIYGHVITYQELCDASGYGDACSAKDPMRWLVNKWSAEGDADETAVPYEGHVRDFVKNSEIFLPYFNDSDWQIWDGSEPSPPFCTGSCRNPKVTYDEDYNRIYSVDLPNGIYLISIGGQRAVVSTVGGYLDVSRSDFLGTKEIARKGSGRGSRITKKVKDKTYNVGDPAEYTINIVMPKDRRYGDYGDYHFKVVDKFSAGLSYVKGKFDAKVILDGVTIPEATAATPAGYKLYVFDKTCSTNDDDCDTKGGHANLADSSDEVPEARIYFDLSPYIYSRFGIGTDKEEILGKSLKVVYHAVVNSNAGKGDPVDNNAKMRYYINSCGCEITWAGASYDVANRVGIYSGGFSIQQVSEAGGYIMEGAKFSVSHKEDPDHPIRFNEVSKGSLTEPSQYCAASASETNSTDRITVGASGKMNVTGLADGTYILKQLTAAHGWTLVSGFEFEITIQHDDNGDGTKSQTQSIGSDPYGMASLGGGAGDGNGRVVNVRYIGSLRDVPATSPVGMGVRALLGVMTVLCGAGILVGVRKLKRRSDMSGLNV